MMQLARGAIQPCWDCAELRSSVFLTVGARELWEDCGLGSWWGVVAVEIEQYLTGHNQGRGRHCLEGFLAKKSRSEFCSCKEDRRGEVWQLVGGFPGGQLRLRGSLGENFKKGSRDSEGVQ